MKPIEPWVETSMGIFFILGSIYLIIFTVVLLATLWILLDVRDRVKGLSEKAHNVLDDAGRVSAKVRGIAERVDSTTAMISTKVESTTDSTLAKLEKYAPIAAAVAGLMVLRKLL